MRFGFCLQQREYCYATLILRTVWLSCKVLRGLIMFVVKAYRATWRFRILCQVFFLLTTVSTVL